MKNPKEINGRPVTIYDIAKEAGVSTATVSRVLTNKTKVSQKKREKIEALIDFYGYQPNALARGLSDTKSRVLGIVAADVRNPFYAETFVACEIAAKEAGYTVLLCNSFGLTDIESAQLDMLRQQKVDAIIQLGGRGDDLDSDEAYVEKVKGITQYIPMVVTGKLDGTDCYKVQIDAERSAQLLMEHLIELGHKDFVFIGGRNNVLSTHVKYKTYQKVLERHNIPFNPEYIVEGSYDYDIGYDGMNKMLAHHIPTAVVAINDFLAAGVIRSILENGLRIPEDISVVSYDNVYISELLIPKLTSIDYNYHTFGKALVDTAISAIEEKPTKMLQKVVPSLVIRESSGPAPKK